MAVTVEIPRLRELVVARLSQRFTTEHSDRIADVVMFGELAGRSTHGVIRVLPGRKGAMDEEPGPEPVVERTGPAAARVVGRPGMLVAAMATDLTIELAGRHGFGVVTTSGSRSTSGSLTHHVERLTSAGLVAMVCANTLSFVTPVGGTRRSLGTNPLCIGVPSAGRPLILDIATSAVTFGDVVEADAAGGSLPDGVAVDAAGEPTNDPSAVLEGGALLPFGGHKGLGLSMVVELLAGAIAGADAVGVGPEDVWGHVFIAFSPSMVGDPQEIEGEAQRILERITAIPTRDGVPPRIPGHRSLETRDEALGRGTVDVDDAVFAELVSLVENG